MNIRRLATTGDRLRLITPATPRPALAGLSLLRFFIPAVALLLLAGCATPIPHHQLSPDDRSAIAALGDRYAELAVAGKWEDWAGLFHEEAVRVFPGMPDWDGRENIHRQAATLDPSLQRLEFSTLEVEGNRDLAFARGRFRGSQIVTDNGEATAVEFEAVWLAVFRRNADGAWQYYRFIHHVLP
jgi:uncharacterized protein (TIGR02246 family)